MTLINVFYFEKLIHIHNIQLYTNMCYLIVKNELTNCQSID